MLRLRKIGVLSMACFMGLYGAFIGFILAILVFLLALILPMFFSGGTLISSAFNPQLLNLLLYPIVSGVLSFIGGLISTPIINLVLKIIDGLKCDIEEV